jgi:hypothetical protein
MEIKRRRFARFMAAGSFLVGPSDCLASGDLIGAEGGDYSVKVNCDCCPAAGVYNHGDSLANKPGLIRVFGDGGYTCGGLKYSADFFQVNTFILGLFLDVEGESNIHWVPS